MNEANESFDTKAVLKDILDILRKHGLPAQTVSIDVSMFDDDFDTVIPQLRSYRAGILHRPITIDNVSMLFEAKRRIVFSDLAQWLEQHVLPPTQQFAEELKRKYPKYNILFTISREDNPVGNFPHYFTVGIDCQFSEAIYDDYNSLQLTIYLVQRIPTQYPSIDVRVAWLNDYELMGDIPTWGSDIIYEQAFSQQETLWSMFEKLEEALPTLYDKFQGVIEERANV